MIQNIEYKNYKAFELANVPIKPITILLGANSVGKSSIVQSLLMLQQTGKQDLKSYKSALKLYGGYVNLGDPKNIFRQKNIEQALGFSFDLKSSGLKHYCQEELLDTFVRTFIEIPYFLPLKGFSEIRHNREIKNETEFLKILDAIIDVVSKDSTKKEYQQQLHFFLNRRYHFQIGELSKRNRKEILDTYRFLDSLRKIVKNESFKISFNLTIENSNLVLQDYIVKHGDNTLFDFTYKNKVELSSDIFKLNASESKKAHYLFDVESTIFTCFKPGISENLQSSKLSVIGKIMHKFQQELKNEFSENAINYVSPLRAHPKRYYMLDKAKLNLTLDTLDGDAIAEVLKENKSLTKKVNSWLATFGISVDVKEFREVIHQLIVKQNNLDLDITDVGFGISQVLPVIIQGFLSHKESTTIIEQPEIHLHPKIQAELADLFIDIISISSKRKLIIETHSEYLLKRLRRRISEGILNPNKVAICLFNPQKNGKGGEINVLPVAEKGFFEWPEEFYGGELMKDTTEFLKNQKPN